MKALLDGLRIQLTKLTADLSTKQGLLDTLAAEAKTKQKQFEQLTAAMPAKKKQLAAIQIKETRFQERQKKLLEAIEKVRTYFKPIRDKHAMTASAQAPCRKKVIKYLTKLSNAKNSKITGLSQEASSDVPASTNLGIGALLTKPEAITSDSAAQIDTALALAEKNIRARGEKLQSRLAIAGAAAQEAEAAAQEAEAAAKEASAAVEKASAEVGEAEAAAKEASAAVEKASAEVEEAEAATKEASAAVEKASADTRKQGPEFLHGVNQKKQTSTRKGTPSLMQQKQEIQLLQIQAKLNMLEQRAHFESNLSTIENLLNDHSTTNPDAAPKAPSPVSDAEPKATTESQQREVIVLTNLCRKLHTKAGDAHAATALAQAEIPSAAEGTQQIKIAQEILKHFATLSSKGSSSAEAPKPASQAKLSVPKAATEVSSAPPPIADVAENSLLQALAQDIAEQYTPPRKGEHLIEAQVVVALTNYLQMDNTYIADFVLTNFPQPASVTHKAERFTPPNTNGEESLNHIATHNAQVIITRLLMPHTLNSENKTMALNLLDRWWKTIGSELGDTDYLKFRGVALQFCFIELERDSHVSLIPNLKQLKLASKAGKRQARKKGNCTFVQHQLEEAAIAFSNLALFINEITKKKKRDSNSEYLRDRITTIVEPLQLLSLILKAIIADCIAAKGKRGSASSTVTGLTQHAQLLIEQIKRTQLSSAIPQGQEDGEPDLADLLKTISSNPTKFCAKASKKTASAILNLLPTRKRLIASHRFLEAHIEALCTMSPEMALFSSLKPQAQLATKLSEIPQTPIVEATPEPVLPCTDPLLVTMIDVLEMIENYKAQELRPASQTITTDQEPKGAAAPQIIRTLWESQNYRAIADKCRLYTDQCKVENDKSQKRDIDKDQADIYFCLQQCQHYLKKLADIKIPSSQPSFTLARRLVLTHLLSRCVITLNPQDNSKLKDNKTWQRWCATQQLDDHVAEELITICSSKSNEAKQAASSYMSFEQMDSAESSPVVESSAALQKTARSVMPIPKRLTHPTLLEVSRYLKLAHKHHNAKQAEESLASIEIAPQEKTGNMPPVTTPGARTPSTNSPALFKPANPEDSDNGHVANASATTTTTNAKITLD